MPLPAYRLITISKWGDWGVRLHAERRNHVPEAVALDLNSFEVHDVEMLCYAFYLKSSFTSAFSIRSRAKVAALGQSPAYVGLISRCWSSTRMLLWGSHLMNCTDRTVKTKFQKIETKTKIYESENEEEERKRSMFLVSKS